MYMILPDFDKKGENSGENNKGENSGENNKGGNSGENNKGGNSGEKDKELIKVFVITGPKTSGIVTYEADAFGKKSYSGIAWDIVEAVKKLPDFEKYRFEYTFSEPGYNNYNETVEWVSSGKYDLGLAVYMQNKTREHKINYTAPIMIDAFGLFHYQDTSVFDAFKDVLSQIGGMVLTLFMLGIITGIILFIVDPQRSKATNIKNRKLFFIRSIMTGISTFFGEAGFLFENSSSSIKGLIAVTTIMLLAVIFLQFMQAEITSLLIDRKMGKAITPQEIKSIPAIGHEGYAHTTRWEENDGLVERYKMKNNTELLEIYKKNPDKYLGVILSYYDGYPFLDLHPGISASTFGNTPVCMIYNPNKVRFGEDLNKGLLHIRATNELKKICRSYFRSSDPNAPPACTL